MLYASPEMFHVMTASHGDQTIAARSVDVRTDVFSLALVGYFLRTGRNPTSQYINLMTLLVANLECAEGLHDVLKKACEFAAKDRFADMHAFMAALRELASRPATVIVNRRPPDPPWVASPETPTPPPARPPANDADHLADADPFPLPIVRPVRPRPSHRAKVEARTLAPKHERSFSTPITAAPTTLVARTSPRVADKPTRRWIPLLAFTTIAASLALSVLHCYSPDYLRDLVPV